MTADDDGYCALHIAPAHPASAEDVAGWIAAAIGGQQKGRVAFDEFALFEVRFDKFADAEARDEDFPAWPVRVECLPIGDAPPSAIYRQVLFTAIRKLRTERRARVVAVCEFEDEVRAATGWNWTATDPRQPEPTA